jgi:SdiA-regulated
VARLRVTRTFSIPLAEVSGLAVRHAGGRSELLAIGDATAGLARADLVGGEPGEWRVHRIEGVDDGDGSQLEAVAVGSDGRILLLRESPPALMRLDEGGVSVERTLRGEVGDDPGWLAVRGEESNSLGEGLALGPGGELVLAKEKRPSALLEARLTDAAVILERHWLLAPSLAEEMADVSDLAFGPDGRLYLLSDQSSTIARLPAGWRDATEVEAESVWRLPGEIEKAEGLVVLPDGRALVAVDRKKAKHNLFLLEPPLA